MTTTAQIAAKGCKNTGLTETIAKRLHDQLGTTIVAVVEITSDARTENRDGDEKVKLNITSIEIAPDTLTADHLRELARAFNYERKLEEDGPGLLDPDAGPAPKVKDVLEGGARHLPHPYLASTLSTDDNAICDVCGTVESTAVHQVIDDDADEPDELDDPTDTDGESDVDGEPPAEPEQDLLDQTDGDDTATTRHLHPIPDPFTA